MVAPVSQGQIYKDTKTTKKNYLLKKTKGLSADQWEKAKKDKTFIWPKPTMISDIFDDLQSIENHVEEEWVGGLATVLFPSKKKNSAPIGSPDLEAFLRQVENTLLSETIENKNKINSRQDPISIEIRHLMDVMNETEFVVIPTDKTNSFKTMDIKNYRQEVAIPAGTSSGSHKREIGRDTR